jgi:CHAT domain-containing protein
VLPNQAEISLERVRHFLDDDTTLLEYFFAGDRILAAIVTNKTLEIVPVTTAPRVADSLRLLRFQLGKVQLNHGAQDTASVNSYRPTLAHLGNLYSELLAPVRPLLQGRQLVVVPHGILHYLPFHALHDGHTFLADSYNVSYAPSAAVFALCHARSSETSHGSLVMGVPDERAPLIKDEVESVHKSLAGSELFLGVDANHETIARRATSSRIIHIATHGSFRPDNPMFSGIKLGDGYLHLYELYRLRLSAELLTLSGCATGLNVIAAGDELLGLIRGALYAGARSLLLTLWEVNDRSSAEFMTSFYKRLPSSKSKAEALAQASKEVRESHPHPYHWAPFVIVGKGLSGI